MKVLVTGGAGFIGGHLIDALLAQNAEVRVIDNFSTGRRENIDRVRNRIDFIEADICDPEAIARAVHGVELVFHEAAIPSVSRSVADPVASNQANVGGTVSVLNAARLAGVRKLVYAASSSAYGDTPTLPKVETMTPRPMSPYAISKLAGEQYVTVFGKLYGFETVSLRYFNVFGPRQDPKSEYAAVIPRFVTTILAGQRPVIFGDGEQTRDFCFIENTVSANLLAAKATTHGEVVNVACGARVSLNALIKLINEELGTDVKPEYATGRPGDVRDSLADITAAQKLLGYEVLFDLRAGLKKAIDWYRANPVGA
ncbi:MAG: SDR family oxidoreductase [Myxococcaceae bacterium]|nr:MAG: SDR family oxidoreductase [Myxococcaceae bacterium]